MFLHNILPILMIASPAIWFSFSLISFFVAIQRPPHHPLRWIFSTLHISSAIRCLTRDDTSAYPAPTAAFVTGLTLHATATLLIEKRVVTLDPAPSTHRIQVTFRIWSDIRRILPAHVVVNSKTRTPNRVRIVFAIRRCVCAISFWVIYRSTCKVLSDIIYTFNIGLADFDSTKQGLLPFMTSRDVGLRALMAIYWIWHSYVWLTVPHHVFSILFVSVLRWDSPSEWPALFGSVTAVYSLRTFWGGFWHSLHVHTFVAYMPSFLHTPGRGTQEAQCGRAIRNALRSLWIFLFSACCHAAVSWVRFRTNSLRRELRFFLSNYAICLMETILRWMVGVNTIKGGGWFIRKRLLGCLWVFIVFFCLVPAWQYPVIYQYTASQTQRVSYGNSGDSV